MMNDPIREVVRKIMESVPAPNQSVPAPNQGELKPGEIAKKDFDLIRGWGVALGASGGGLFAIVLGLIEPSMPTWFIGVVLVVIGGIRGLLVYFRLLKVDLVD